MFPFGHGLSYTTFEYSDLALTPSAGGLTVEYTITNTGAVAGKEASQVYLTLPPEAGQPSKRLVGFQKVAIQPGQSHRVSIALDCTASNHPFSYFLPASETDLEKWAEGNWVTPSGEFIVHVGTSSADTPLETPIGLTLNGCTQPTPGLMTAQPPSG